MLITGKSIPHLPLGQKKKYPPIYTTRMLLDTNNLEPPESQKCLKCKNNLPLISFPWSHQKEGHTLTCIKCTASKKEWRQKQKLAKGSILTCREAFQWIKGPKFEMTSCSMSPPGQQPNSPKKEIFQIWLSFTC